MSTPATPRPTLADAVRDFLYAVDRGDFGTHLCHGPAGDRHESAFVVALRAGVDQHEEHGCNDDA